MPQLSVALSPSLAYPGQIAEPAPRFSRSFSTEAAGLVAGQIVVRGTLPAEQIAAVPTSAFTPTAASIAGVIVHSSSKPFTDDGLLPANERVSVLRLGSIYMEFAEAVTAGEMVGYTLATGALTGWAQGTAAGSITTGVVIIPGMRIASTTSAAGLAIVEVCLFGSQDAATVGSA